ncbi:Zinc finger, PMZ-type [Parasponia andersonii]|uniref:Zinc finger, PMZ-type n=1 Tax=Parasponia andersonii TaxID=3476 RepID=A0A2P5ASF5_PARAD|nr:Zinc finger, PMZ-type [Parasponia andersonii]
MEWIISPNISPVKNVATCPRGAEKIDELKECFGEVAKTPGITTGTSSSRVRRVRIVDNEAKWIAPLFSKGELPQGTPNNLSVGSFNSVKIVIGQLFENKKDLKLKLHLHAMKYNFEFKTNIGNESNKSLPIKIEKKLEDRIEAAKTLIVQPLNHYEFYVIDGDRDGQVNLQTKTCSCRRFDLTGLPYTHALAATLSRRINPYSLYSWYYTVDAWLCLYAETIYPVGNEEKWDVPDDISRRKVEPPSYKPKPNRLKIKRTKSKGEKIIMQRHCSRVVERATIGQLVRT